MNPVQIPSTHVELGSAPYFSQSVLSTHITQMPRARSHTPEPSGVTQFSSPEHAIQQICKSGSQAYPAGHVGTAAFATQLTQRWLTGSHWFS